MEFAALPGSTLNPNALEFVPQSFKQVEDFSADWWLLIQTSPSFREFWTKENGEPQEYMPEMDEFEGEGYEGEAYDDEFLPEENVVYESLMEQYFVLPQEIVQQ